MLNETQVREAVARLAKHFDTVDRMWPLRIHREAIDMRVGDMRNESPWTRPGTVDTFREGCCCIIGQITGSYTNALVKGNKWCDTPNHIALNWPHAVNALWGESEREGAIQHWADTAEAAWIAEIDRRMPACLEECYLAS